MHFTRMSSLRRHDIPVIVRGEGAYVCDQHGKRYLDGLSGLFVVQVGPRPPGDRRGGRAAGRASWPTSRCGPTPTPTRSSSPSGWPTLAPGDLNRVFFTTGGSEAVETAWKLAKQYFKLTGQPGRYKVISRDIAYHGTSMGALSITGLADIKYAVRAAGPGRRPGAEHQLLPGARVRRRRPGGVRPVGRGRDRAGHPARGPGVGRRGLPRAGAELRRLLPAAARLLRAGPGDLRHVRRAAGLRRGDLRVRPARLLLRLPSGTATSRTSSPSPRA